MKMREVYDVRLHNRKSAVFAWLACIEALRIQGKVEGRSPDVARAVVFYVRCAYEMKDRMMKAEREKKRHRISEREMNLRCDNAAAAFEGALNLFRPHREKKKTTDEYAWDGLRHIQAAYGIESPEYRTAQGAAYRLQQFHDECACWAKGDYSRKLPPRRRYVAEEPDQKNVDANFAVLYGDDQKP